MSSTFKVAWLNPENKVLTNNDRRIIDDIRITIERQRLNEWNLHVRNIQHFDEGIYSCSISTDPVQTKKVYLKVLGRLKQICFEVEQIKLALF